MIIYKLRGNPFEGGLVNARDTFHSVVLHTGPGAGLFPGFKTHKWDLYNCYMAPAALCDPPVTLQSPPFPCPTTVAPGDRFKTLENLNVQGCQPPPASPYREEWSPR